MNVIRFKNFKISVKMPVFRGYSFPYSVACHLRHHKEPKSYEKTGANIQTILSSQKPGFPPYIRSSPSEGYSNHSVRNASIGFTRAARRAGNQQAKNATPISNTITATNVSGSMVSVS